jgi:hypothetical protein
LHFGGTVTFDKDRRGSQGSAASGQPAEVEWSEAKPTGPISNLTAKDSDQIRLFLLYRNRLEKCFPEKKRLASCHATDDLSSA